MPSTCGTLLAYLRMDACTLDVYCVLLCVLISEQVAGLGLYNTSLRSFMQTDKHMTDHFTLV